MQSLSGPVEFAGPTGAPRTQVVPPKPRLISPTRSDVMGQLQHRGNGNYGTVIHLGQATLLGAEQGEPLQLERVTESQKAILDTLFLLRPQHVFAEGVPLRLPAQPQQDPARRDIRAAFAAWRPGQPINPSQAEMLIQVGAARTWAALAQGEIQMHGTTDANLEERCALGVAASGKKSMPDPASSAIMRQKFLVARLVDFFRERRGERAVVIMDAVYDFENYCETAGLFDPNFYYNDLSLAPREELARQRTLLYGR
jgi:hypothetical protein